MDLVSSGKKRFREDEDGSTRYDGLSEKRARPTVESRDSDSWARDSVLNTPTTTHARTQPKYDSDDELASSVVSEPGSPQDISMSSDDEDVGRTFSRSPEDVLPRPGSIQTWGQRVRADRVATPIIPWRPGTVPLQIRSAIKQHVRQRHPQENLSSDHLGPPSPIDEDEVPTPPSAAEAAGSQLSLLTVNDVDMADEVPTIAIDSARQVDTPSIGEEADDTGSAIDIDPVDHTRETLMVRKQRQRSGALSSGNSPVRASSTNTGAKRGFSIGFRPDCEKCQTRMPGHMNHFVS